MKILELKQKSNKALTFLLSLVKEEERFKILYFSLLIISSITLILGFEWSLYIVWWLLGFGWSLFFFKKHLNLLENFLLSGVVFTSIFLVYICLFAIVNIPVNIFFFLGFILISLTVFLKGEVFKHVNLNISDYDYLILFLFFVALVAKVFPLRNYFAAPLHDPISHSMMAKNIVETGLIEYFYSPGLHILSAFGEMAGGFFVSKQVMILSVFFSAYSGIIAYIFIKNFFKDKVWGLVTGTLFSIGYFPTYLTFNAGKNSLIMALPILFFVMFTTVQYIKKKNWKILLITIITMVSLFLIHYPIAVLGAIFLGTAFIIFFKDFKGKGFLIVFGILLGLLWAASRYKYQIAIMDELADPNKTSLSHINDFESTKDSVLYFFNNIKGSIYTHLRDWDRYPTILSFFGFVFLLIIGFLNKNKKYIVILVWILFITTIFLILHITRISIFTILFESYLLSLSVYTYILCGFFVSLVFKTLLRFFDKEKKLILSSMLIGALLSAMIIFSYLLYKESRISIEDGGYVGETDIEAFEWINDNLDDNQKVVVNAYKSPANIVLSSDAGGYLEIFTKNEISNPFYEYNTKESFENYELYEALQEDLTACEYAEEFLDKGYKYYYQGSIPFFASYLAPEEELTEVAGFEVVYKNDKSILFLIKGCE